MRSAAAGRPASSAPPHTHRRRVPPPLASPPLALPLGSSTSSTKAPRCARARRPAAARSRGRRGGAAHVVEHGSGRRGVAPEREPRALARLEPCRWRRRRFVAQLARREVGAEEWRLAPHLLAVRARLVLERCDEEERHDGGGGRRVGGGDLTQPEVDLDAELLAEVAWRAPPRATTLPRPEDQIEEPISHDSRRRWPGAGVGVGIRAGVGVGIGGVGVGGLWPARARIEHNVAVVRAQREAPQVPSREGSSTQTRRRPVKRRGRAPTPRPVSRSHARR